MTSLENRSRKYRILSYAVVILTICIVAALFPWHRMGNPYPMKMPEFSSQRKKIQIGSELETVDRFLMGYTHRVEKEGVVEYQMKPDKTKFSLMPLLTYVIIVKIDDDRIVTGVEWADR